MPGIQGIPKAFQEFTDMFAVDYNLLKDKLKTRNENRQRSGKPYTKYEVLKAMETKSGKIARGLISRRGKQFLSEFSANELIDRGIIRVRRIMMFTLEEVKKQIFKMSGRIGIKENSNLLPMFSKTKEIFNEGASIYVDDKYHYIIMERGRVYKHYESEILEDILYPMFKDMTFSLAQEFELKHRKKGDDFRKLLWKKQLKLLGKINKKFVDMRKKEIEEVLKIAPYSK